MLVDTGATWSILVPDAASVLGVSRSEGMETTVQTADGPCRGVVAKVDLEIPAQDGEALRVQCSVFLTADWRRGPVIGYRGFLDHIRFAVEPVERSFYFGAIP
jgi:predicted aspartyl protease